ncbi:organic solute transporter Ostalpha-domain-containing protein [Gorgonomyces haynaldii]|nr:organic solute transporter Ostalpha-domain-containing protein [Gorgonomyces haynaldii]
MLEKSQIVFGGQILVTVLGLFNTGSSFYLILGHLRYYLVPRFQKRIVRILILIPIYSFFSSLSYALVTYGHHLTRIRDIYETFVVYNFFMLFCEYLAPHNEGRRSILSLKGPAMNPPPFCFWNFDPSNPFFLERCLLGVLQYPFLKSIGTIVAIALEIGLGWSMQPFMSLLNFATVSLAMFSMISFYIPIHHEIYRFGPVGQFLSVKFVVFFQLWLGIMLGPVSDSLAQQLKVDPHLFKVYSEAVIISLEMTVASILHLRFFSFKGYIPKQPYKNLSVFGTLQQIGSWRDFVEAVQLARKFEYFVQNDREYEPLLPR